jgi:hypothetical protein
MRSDWRQTVAAAALAFSSLGLAGFDLSGHEIPVEDILSGGPPKDGIPALFAPRFVAAADASFLAPDDRVIGVAREGEAKAYPMRILNWHEVVNDTVGSKSIAVTYCPLTASAVVYDRTVGNETLSFGVSGRLYQSNVLFYDRQSESLWSQLGERAVTGPRAGTGLEALPATETTWKDWRRLHPHTLVLSPDTGHRRDYDRDPYAAYHASPRTMFPVRHEDARLPAKEKVLGLSVGKASKAYPLSRLSAAGQVEDRIGAAAVRIDYDREAEHAAVVVLPSGESLPAVLVYWFAWAAFHPDTQLWAGGGAAPARAAPFPDSPTGSAKGSDGVAIERHSAYWTSVFGLGLSGGGAHGTEGPALLIIRGELRNNAGRPLDHVKLLFELLDSNRRVVASEYGYNLGAETLRPLDSPHPVNLAAGPTVSPIRAGGTDGFRMMFLREEIPAFESYRVRVIGAGDDES